MAEAGNNNIMSVELAIQRELAYRKKVASLSDEFMKDLLPLQVSSSAPRQSANPGPRLSPELSSVTRASQSLVPSSAPRFPSSSPWPIPSSVHRFPSSNSTPTPRPFVGSSPNWIPGSRPWPVPRPSHSSPKRKAPQRPHLPHGNCIVIDSKDGNNYFCKVCQVSCCGPLSVKQHLKGHQHKTKLQMLQLSGTSGGAQEAKIPRFDLCRILCSNEDALKMHFRGQKHKAMVQNLENGEKAPERPWCELCQISCMNEDNYAQHLKGQKHIKNLYARQQNMRATGEY